MYKGSSGFAIITSSRRRITLARRRWTLGISSEPLPARQTTIASTKACSIARATSDLARMSGASLARWLAALCSFRSRARAGAGGVTLVGRVGGANPRPVKISPAAWRSPGAKDIVLHLQGAEDRRYHSQSTPHLAI